MSPDALGAVPKLRNTLGGGRGCDKVLRSPGGERMTKDRWGEGGWRRYDEGLAGGDMTRGQPALISGKGGKGREGGSG